MVIDTGDSDTVSQKPYPIDMNHYQWVKEDIEKLLTGKVICSRRSSWSALIIVVPKGDGGKHLVIDYRALNKVTKMFTWSMPKGEDIFFQVKWSYLCYNIRPPSRLPSHTIGQTLNTENSF